MELKHRCKDLWLQLQQLQVEVNSFQGPTATLNDINVEKNQPVSVSSFMEMNRNFMDISLEAHNDVLENAEVFGLSDNASLSEMLKSELASEDNYLQQTECLLRSQRSELDEEIERLKEMKLHFLKFKGSLEEKLKVVSTTDTSADRDLVDLQRENSRLKSVAAVRHRQMEDFLSKHYPPPTVQEIEAWNKKNLSSKKSQKKFLSLSNIIDQLMKKSVESPEDPFIDLNDMFWPPYVELLLRCGIASRHPEICEKIRLTLYHQ